MALLGYINPPFNYAGISIMHAINDCAPLSREATLLQLCTPIFMEDTKAIRILAQKSALQLCTPSRPAKRRPFNYAGANLFGGFTQSDQELIPFSGTAVSRFRRGRGGRGFTDPRPAGFQGLRSLQYFPDPRSIPCPLLYAPNSFTNPSHLTPLTSNARGPL